MVKNKIFLIVSSFVAALDLGLLALSIWLFIYQQSLGTGGHIVVACTLMPYSALSFLLIFISYILVIVGENNDSIKDSYFAPSLISSIIQVISIICIPYLILMIDCRTYNAPEDQKKKLELRYYCASLYSVLTILFLIFLSLGLTVLNVFLDKMMPITLLAISFSFFIPSIFAYIAFTDPNVKKVKNIISTTLSFVLPGLIYFLVYYFLLGNLQVDAPNWYLISQLVLITAMLFAEAVNVIFIVLGVKKGEPSGFLFSFLISFAASGIIILLLNYFTFRGVIFMSVVGMIIGVLLLIATIVGIGFILYKFFSLASENTSDSNTHAGPIKTVKIEYSDDYGRRDSESSILRDIEYAVNDACHDSSNTISSYASSVNAYNRYSYIEVNATVKISIDDMDYLIRNNIDVESRIREMCDRIKREAISSAKYAYEKTTGLEGVNEVRVYLDFSVNS